MPLVESFVLVLQAGGEVPENLDLRYKMCSILSRKENYVALPSKPWVMEN